MFETPRKLLLHYLAALFLYAVAALSAGLAGYLAYQDKPASAALMAAMFISSILLTNMERIKIISAFGMKAEMREVRAVIREAQATLSQVRDLSLVFAGSSLYQMSRQGFLAQADWNTRSEMVQAITKTLTELGVSPSEIRAIRYPIFETASWVIHDALKFLILNTFARRFPDKFHELDIREQGDDPAGMQKLIERVKKDERFTIEEKRSLAAAHKHLEKIKRDSEKKGYLTEEALFVLQSDHNNEFADRLLKRTPEEPN